MRFHNESWKLGVKQDLSTLHLLYELHQLSVSFWVQSFLKTMGPGYLQDCFSLKASAHPIRLDR